MGLHVPLDDARRLFREGLDAFVATVSDLPELDLLGASRCHGWSRLEVVSHVVAGGEEMLGGLVSVTEEPPTVDAASYWTAFATEYADEDPVAVLMAQRRRAVAYTGPRSAVAHLRDVAAALDRGAAAVTSVRLQWQGQVFEAGDFLAVWAVENAVHHLDLLVDVPPPDAALALTRSTVEALLGESLPASWSDVEAALVGSGRTPPPAELGDLGELSERLPVLG